MTVYACFCARLERENVSTKAGEKLAFHARVQGSTGSPAVSKTNAAGLSFLPKTCSGTNLILSCLI
jgi:hypothetical protein